VPLIAAVASFGVAYAVIFWLLRSGLMPMDRPNIRSLHVRVGSIPLGFMAAGLAVPGWQRQLWPASFPLLAVFAVHCRCDSDPAATLADGRKDMAGAQ